MVDIQSLINRNRFGVATGLPCFCTANELVLRAVMEYVAYHQLPVVIEATCNQVNQDGGYTGLNAAGFAHWVALLAREYGVPQDLITLGGDHLGPNPWRHLEAELAMEKAEIMVQEYAAAGFRKIHLDASMACHGESIPSFDLVAERAARLCAVAEAHAPEPEHLIYIIGTEVPAPGGETDDMKGLSVTSVARLQETMDTHHDAFERHELKRAWSRVVSIVIQPGVDFSHTAVRQFKPAEANALSAAIGEIPGIGFEAHSTDYQPTVSLEELVANHFFFLKVGPELTFRMREAVFALAHIEQHLLEHDLSDLINVIDQAMDDKPADWESYYQGDHRTVAQLRHFSYSDRIRYYWAVPAVKEAVARLTGNLERLQLPDSLISQYFPTREFGGISAPPVRLVTDHIKLCIGRYYRACGY